MNVGIVTTWFDRGAAYVSRAYRDALTADHDVFIYARAGEHTGRGDPSWDQPYVTWGADAPGKVVTHVDWNDFRRWVERERIEVILFNEQISWDVIVRSRQLGVPIGAYVDYYTKRTVPLFRLYDFLLCNTMRHHGVFSDHPNALYIPWGTDCDVFRPAPRTRPSDGVTFFHSAGMRGTNGRKGTDLLVRAFQDVTGRARLVIHSQVPVEDYPEADAIRRDDRITFVQKTVGPPGLYHMGDVYVYPSKLEGIGLTIAEALASGLPVITTDVAPMNEFVASGVTGSLIPVAGYHRRGDEYYWPEAICRVESVRDAMQTYVDGRHDIPAMSAAAREYAVMHRDWRKNAAVLPKFLRRVRPVSVSDRVVRAALRYERSQYPATGLERIPRALSWRWRRMRSWLQARRQRA